MEEQSKEDSQVCAVTPRPKSKGPKRGRLQPVLPKLTLNGLKPPETRKGGKGGAKGRRSRSEPRPERRKQQCKLFYRGICKKRSDGKPVPVGPEILQRYDDAVKRISESKAQAKAKSAPKGGVGVSASMIVLEAESEGVKVAAHAVKVPVSDEYYATVDSGTNAIIVPLHPDMCGDMAECKVPSATDEGPIVKVLKYGQERCLVVALPQSAILISQEWLTRAFLESHGGHCGCNYSGFGTSVARLREMIREQVQQARPQIYAVQDVVELPLLLASQQSSRLHQLSYRDS